jgi:hypothetical protein
MNRPTVDQIISDIYKEWKPETRVEEWEGRHGSDKGEMHKSLYYRTDYGAWVHKGEAFEVHLLNVLRPSIRQTLEANEDEPSYL